MALGDQDDQVIVIDAVDEAGTHDRNNELLSLLQGELQNLPSWVRMLVRGRRARRRDAGSQRRAILAGTLARVPVHPGHEPP